MLRNLISFTVAAFTTFAAVNPGYAAGESKLIAAIPSFSNDTAGLMRAAAAGKTAGWRVPTKKQNNVPISGTWKFSTHRGESGTITFASGGKIVYGTGKSAGAFSSYSFLSNKSVPASPILVSLKGGFKQVNYMPFIKGKQITLLNVSNKSQWISLSR